MWCGVLVLKCGVCCSGFSVFGGVVVSENVQVVLCSGSVLGMLKFSWISGFISVVSVVE